MAEKESEMSHSIVFFGTPDFATPALDALLKHPNISVEAVVTQPDRIAGRGKNKRKPPVKLLAEQHDLRIFQPESVKKEQEWFSTLPQCSGAVVVAFGQIFPQWLIQHFNSTCINIHSSLLPRWRGAAPMQRAIMAGDKKSGVCLMQITPAMDAGPIYARKECDLTSEDTFGSLHDRLAQMGAQLLSENVHAILDGTLQATPQPEEGITYAKKIDKSESLLDWSLPAETVSNILRGLSPHPGAYTFFEGKRLKVLAAQHKRITCELTPGNVFQKEGSCYIKCGDFVVEPTLLQLEGRKVCTVAEFLRGHENFVGTTLA